TRVAAIQAQPQLVIGQISRVAGERRPVAGRNTMTSTRTQSSPTSPLALLHELADNWWLVLLRGIAAIAFGILAFFWPAIALVTLVFLWGTYAIVDGVLALGAAIAGMSGEVV